MMHVKHLALVNYVPFSPTMNLEIKLPSES